MSQSKKTNLHKRSRIHSNRVVSLLVFFGLLAAVVVSVSVQSRTVGWLRKVQPADQSTAVTPARKADSNSTTVNRNLESGPRLAAPPPPTVTATKTDSLFTDLDNDGKADPGDTLKYTVTITANGADATGVQFSDTVDPNTTFVAGTLMTTPIARADSYSALGNVRISVPAPGVLANDSDPDGVGPAITATAGTFLSAQGGNVNLNADGSFTYNPPAGFEGSDSFTYTLNDNDSPNNTDTATVSLTVSGMIWFIDNNASCPCDGRLTNPFNSIASFQAVNNGSGNNPAANDNIFIYESASNYTGSLTLLNGQRLIGQDASASLSSITGLTPPPNSDPLPVTNSANGTIVNLTSAGTSITVGSGNTLTGFTGGNSNTDISGSGFGTLTISDVTLNGAGQALDLTNGTLAATFGSISSTNSATTGISLSSVAGSLTSGSTTITNSTGIGISVGISSATLAFGNTSVPGSTATGISLTTNTGAITFGSLDIAPAANQRALLAIDNTNTITSTSGAISNSGATAVQIVRTTGTTPLNITLTSVTSAGGNSNGITLQNTSGSFSVVGDGTNTSVGGNSTGGTISNKSGVDGSTTEGSGVFLSNANNVTLRRMTINGTNQNFGVRGLSVAGFTLEYSTVNGTNGTSVTGGSEEGSVRFDNLLGSASVSSSSISGGAALNVWVLNTSGTLNRLTMANDAIGLNGNLGGDSVLLQASNSGTVLNATVTDTTFQGSRGSPFQAVSQSGTTVDLVFGQPGHGNTVHNTHPNIVPFAQDLNIGAGGTMTFDINSNHFDCASAVQAQGGVFINSASNSGFATGYFRNNSIGNSGVANSGSSGNDPALDIESNGGGDLTIVVDNNQIFQFGSNGAGFLLQAGTSGGNPVTFNATVTNNTIAQPGTFAVANNAQGFQLNNGTQSGENFTTCLSFQGNVLNGSGTGAGGDARFRQRQNTKVQMPGYTGAPDGTSVSPTVASYIQSLNPTGPPTVTSQSSTSGGGGFFNTPSGAPCTGPFFGPDAQFVSDPAERLGAARVDDDTVGSAGQSKVSDSTLWAIQGENTLESHAVKLTPTEAAAMLQAAIARWADAGASAGDLAKFQSASIEIADLPDGQLATVVGSKIILDETAAGYGWFYDTTPSDDNEFAVPVPDKERQATETSAAYIGIDLLTVLTRELGLQVNGGTPALHGPAASLMQATLGTGTRRAPAFKVSKAAKLQSESKAPAQQARATTEKVNPSYQPVASLNAPRGARTLKNHAARSATPLTFSDVLLNIGTLPAGKSITITFNAQVNNPFAGPGATVCNQGVVSGTNFANVLTDDPDVGGATDPTCTAIDLNADLEVTKSDSPDPVVAGTNLTYTINFTNHGPNNSGATVTDATPAGTTFVSASVTSGSGWSITNPGVGNTGNVVFSKTSTASGETAVFQMVVKVNSSVAGGSTINNSVTAASSDGINDPVPGNNTGTASTAVIAQADLSITKTDGATTAIPGTPITYTITVTNNGPSDANGATVSDTFPGTLTGVTYTSVAAGGATGNTAAGSGNISDTVNMPSGSSVTYTVNANIQSSATGSLSNTATVTSPGGVTDPTPGNNSATDTDTLTPQADLSITKTDGVTSAVPGTAVTYTITVTNNGPSDAPGATVSDSFPGTLTGVTYTSVAAGGATGNTAAGSGNISDTVNMPSGSSVTYTVSANIQSSATGSLSNTATVTSPGGVTDPTPGNNSATDTDTLTPQADLSITKTDGVTSAVPGTAVTYTITVTNNGPSDAPGATVSDTFPGTLTGVTYTSVAAGGATGNTAAGSGNISDTVNMPSGSSVTYTVSANIQSSATGSLSNTATVTAPGGVTDPTPGNNSATDTDTLTPSADVSVTKTDSPDPVVVGNNITYTITVTNNGPSDAFSLSLSDAVPTNTTLVSVTTPAGWTRTDAVPAGGTGTLTFTAPTLPSTMSSVFTVVVNVNMGTPNGTTISNTANVSSATADPTPGNNSSTATTSVQALADLAINKTRSPNTASIDAGNNVVYTIQVANNGPAPAGGVSFSDSVPAGLEVVSQSNPAGWSCNTLAVGSNGTITCTKATMANGETATLTVVAKVSCADANGSTITNNSSISAASPPDGVPGNNSSSTSFTVNNPAVVVTASVALSQLPQNNHELVNVGLSALASGGTVNCPPGPLTVEVFGDEDDETDTGHNEVYSPDAKDIAVGTLRLRQERVDSGDGRVYLIVVRSGSSFATVTVVVPKSSSTANVNAVLAEAAAAKAYADAHNGAPPAGYFVIGDGAIIGNKQ